MQNPMQNPTHMPMQITKQDHPEINTDLLRSGAPELHCRHCMQKSSFRKFVLLLCSHLWLLHGSFVQATTLLGMDIDAVAADAELIFEGEVIQRETRLDQNSDLINTYVTFHVIDVIKGDYSGDSLELKFMGGAFDGQMVEISGLVMPAEGEQGIYFVESLNTDMINPLLGWSQGHYLIVDDEGVRRMSTVEHLPVVGVQSVTAIPLTIKKPQTVIEGNADAAVGVMTEDSALQIDRALTVDEFKSRIETILGN